MATTPGTDLASVEAGLDALDRPAERTDTRWRRVARSAVPPIAAIALVLLLWQAAVWLHLKPRYTLPSPSDTWSAFTEQWHQGTVTRAAWNSLHRGILGFGVSVVIGTALGLLVGRVRLVRAAIGPALTGLQILPSVAWVPAAIIWFGLSNSAMYFVVVMGAVPSIANGLVSGLDGIPPLYQRVGRVLGARGMAQVRHILFPAALPGFVSGLRQGWAFSWRSLMAAELITYSPKLGPGLGQMLDTGRELLRIDLVFASILLILVVGIAIELCLFAPVERAVLRRRGLAGAAK